MPSIFGYIRTSRRLQEGVPGMDPASQELQLRRAGVPLDYIYRDVGVSGTTGTVNRRLLNVVFSLVLQSHITDSALPPGC